MSLNINGSLCLVKAKYFQTRQFHTQSAGKYGIVNFRSARFNCETLRENAIRLKLPKSFHFSHKGLYLRNYEEYF